jgi:two-component system phosphate regulon sensor histidine kinase PhoR
LRVTLIDTTGTVLGDSDNDPEAMDNHLNRPEMIDARTGGFGQSTRFSRTLNADYLYVAKHLVDSTIIGYIRFSMPLTALQSFQQDIGRWILITGIVLLLLAALIVYVYSLHLRRPLSDIRTFTAELAGGDLSVRLLKPAKGDIAGLYKDLNRMAERLEDSFRVIANERDTLTGVLSAMVDGVCVIDKEGKILLTNDSFQKMFAAAGNPHDKDIISVIRQSSFLDLIDRCKTDKGHKKAELEMPGTGLTYMVNGFHLPGPGGWVFAFTDITGSKNLERIKADFITNLSHELRTPLTAIKGYLETIENPSVDPATREKFLRIIRGNTERLTSIVADLLTLSDLERTERTIAHDEFNLNELASDVIALFNNEAEKKKVKLIFTPRPLPSYAGDRFMLQQLLINLISNGIRFTEKGEVKLEIDHDDGRFVIRVSDTGIGIPSEEIPRIFERFYTVDKARSRSQGGTGLGLAIVKHIVQAYKGEIKVESCLGIGSVFTVILPV